MTIGSEKLQGSQKGVLIESEKVEDSQNEMSIGSEKVEGSYIASVVVWFDSLLF